MENTFSSLPEHVLGGEKAFSRRKTWLTFHWLLLDLHMPGSCDLFGLKSGRRLVLPEPFDATDGRDWRPRPRTRRPLYIVRHGVRAALLQLRRRHR